MRQASVEAATARDTAAALMCDLQFAAADELLRGAAQQARAADDAAGLYLILQARAEMLRGQEQRVEAVPVFLEAVAACRRAQGSADELGRLEASIAFTLVNIGLPDEATEHAAAALELSESMTRLDERVRALNAVALTNTRLGHFSSARSLYSQIVREGRVARGGGGATAGERGRAMINLGVCLNDEARTLEPDDPRRGRLLRRQIRCNRAALTAPLRPGNGLAALLNTTDALVMLARLDDASQQLAALERPLQDCADTELRAFATGLAARISMGRGDCDTAATLFTRAIAQFDAVDSQDEVPMLLEALSQAEEARGHLPAALAAERRASAMQRARAKALAETRLRVLEARYERELARRSAEAQRTMEARVEQQRAQLNAQTEALSHAARTDPLTGLGNRRVLEEVATVLGAPSGVPFSVALIDVDHFKHINDRFSHGVGDRVLRAIADVLRENCRPTDVATRYGGEEFVVVLPGMARDVAERVCERLRGRIEDFDWASIGEGIRATVSIGLSGDVCPADLTAVLARADGCLYAAKNAGRNRVRTDER
ncbi:diguanylate cyclase [Aquincola sp. S2]|uniref:diguanylate cyclase n=1 Tax=Pseudaquabacterium terrae TaxID=2732868 RepID=A0ABX2EG46_9BURK|nr:diguanylate cyclase [Aquabacterium terrae]